MKKKLFVLFFSLLSVSVGAEDTATWFRASSISPDGKSIAFSYKGDIFIVASAGGKATRLTSHAAYDGYPCWSPNGQQIAFSSERFGSLDVFVMSKDGGTPKRLTTHSANEVVQTFLDDTHILYSSYYMPTQEDIIFPGNFTQVYCVDTEAHRPQLFSPLAMEAISINKNGEMLYQNNKGYEDTWRKHHRSPITRDLFLSQTAMKDRSYRQLTTDNAENRNAVWTPDGKGYYFLSERDGTMNVYKAQSVGDAGKQITHFKDNPVRYLSISQNGTLCFSWDGALYTMREGETPKKVSIDIVMDDIENFNQPVTVSSGASGFDITKDEKEIIFTLNGDVYAKMVDYTTTKRLTTTPEEESHPSISPDGRTVVYDSERGGTWNIYSLKLQNKKDKNFTYATDIKEEVLIAGKEPVNHPKFSPDGKKIAFLANKTEIRIYDVKSKSIQVALPAKFNYSYSEGDMDFEWSPDSRWLLTSYFGEGGWNNRDVAVVSVDGKKIVNLTRSGYTDGSPEWALGGKAVIWASDRAGYRSHGSWGAEYDVYIMYLDREAYELSKLNKEDRTLYEERLKAEKDSTDIGKDKKDVAKTDKKTKKDKKADKEKSTEEKKDSTEVKPLKLVFEGCENRMARLTVNSSKLGGMYLTPDGKKLYYWASFEGGYDLWLHDLEENSTKIVCKNLGGGRFIPDKKGENIYMCNGSLRKITLSSGTIKELPFQAEKEGQTAAKREYLFDHCVNQIETRFCDVNYHGIDFKTLAAHYRRFLPEISNNRDFSEMVSELLGELNCSHTGLKYRSSKKCPITASLGAFFDNGYQGDGLRIKEIVQGGPLDLASGKIKSGFTILEIDHKKIEKDQDYFPLLAGKAGKWVLLTVTDEKGKNKTDVHVKPVTPALLDDLLYKRWVHRNQEYTEKYSKGEIGYVHVKAMDSQSFRDTYSEILGKYRNCKALVVDDRHNGGGWLHGDLVILLSGKQTHSYTSRGQYLGADPFSRWNRSSCVLICEDCYSNAHGFPALYKSLALGKLVGTPMAGTMTAVWWEYLDGGSLILGIPEMNCVTMDGKLMENEQLDPDIPVENTPAQMLTGDDQQLKQAIDLMLKEGTTK